MRHITHHHTGKLNNIIIYAALVASKKEEMENTREIPFLVKITKASFSTYWYSNYLGQTAWVVEVDGSYRVCDIHTDTKMLTWRYFVTGSMIHKQDAEVLSAANERAEKLEAEKASLDKLVEELEADCYTWRGKYRWIPVSERLPERDEKQPGWSKEVWVTDGVGQITAAYDRVNNKWSFGLTVTHWQPLPPLP